ncbi:MAG: hypothetical protein KJ597_02445 [Nanoarchaeota archaeon]|nr:hypothetical protein [Nanoarchaeota archaeon]MBU1622409.1 hypothetical protein [Nanoarchaeota archaeon]
MKESNWEECLESGSSLKISPDKAKIKSLLETARGRTKYLEENNLKEDNASYVFEGYYSSVLEYLHALILLKGYKINNHICVGYYLRDILNKKDLFRLFDDCRYKRNSLIYYGRRMDFPIAKEAIQKCKRLITDLDLMIKKDF